MTGLEDLVAAAMSAPSERREAALQVLRGHALAVEPGSQAPVYEPLLTQRETARRLGVSVPTLWRWRVPFHALGGRRRYRIPDVIAYLQSETFQRRVAALRAEGRAIRAHARFPFGDGLPRPDRRRHPLHTADSNHADTP